jgi:hypothetical protein
MQNAETAAVAETVSDAYHNKLVSVVEIYRSDLGSLFNIGLQRNIEYALTSKCWTNLIPISTRRKITDGFRDSVNYRGTPIEDDNNHDDVFDEKEQRMFHCARTSELMKDVVCTTGTNYLFGLPAWASIITNKTNFEGISLEAANEQDFLLFIGASASNGTGTGLCRQLLSGVEIDCKYFADPESFPGGSKDDPFRCCSEFTSTGDCVESSIVPGACNGGGQFLMRVKVQNDEVFRKFPRVLAKDTSGNQIRAGAITDKDYDAPITYPFFKYLDAAYKFNKFLAFGTDGSYESAPTGPETDEGANRGVFEGSCLGGDACATAGGFPGSGNYGTTQPDETTALNTYSQDFFNGPLNAACTEVKNMDLGTNFTIATQNMDCDGVRDQNSNTDVRNYFNIGSGNEPPYAFLKEYSNLKITFIDSDLTAQVRPFSSNEFCWYSSSVYSST